MILSMTGYGKATKETPWGKITFEVKSLNSKQADIMLKMPATYRECELDLRALIAKYAVRGKIEAILTVEEHASKAKSVINKDVFSSYLSQISEISTELAITEPSASELYQIILSLPDVFDSSTEETSEQIAEEIKDITIQSLGELCDYRRREGGVLEEFLVERAERIRELLSQIDIYEAERVPKIRARIDEAIKKLNLAEIDQNRLEQEMIFYLEKLDVSEEKSRLQCHINYFLQTIENEENQGKKLGFIAQEMGREINTLGSKSNHSEMQRLVVMMKDELEQIKEQVLNAL